MLLPIHKKTQLTAKWLGVAGVQEHLDGFISSKPLPLVCLQSHGSTQRSVRTTSPGAFPRREIVVGITDEAVERTVRIDRLCEKLVSSDMVAANEATYTYWKSTVACSGDSTFKTLQG